ncbi:uncharacterized protein [Diadema antillarum]|uniref:uncharacterized protein n=1 Tax=Diadema antillarum TaxID=105358 RepID=UPI003A86B25D
MDGEEVLSKLPTTWHELFTKEQVPDLLLGSTEIVERSLLGMGSDNGFHGNRVSSHDRQHHPDWIQLIDALLEEKVCASPNEETHSEGKSEKAHIFCLPLHIRQVLLAVISHHAIEVPLPLLQKLTRCLQDAQLTDHWSLHHVHNLQNYVATHIPSRQGQSSELGSAPCAGFISSRSLPLFEDVCKAIQIKKTVENQQKTPSANISFPQFGGFHSFVKLFQKAEEHPSRTSPLISSERVPSCSKRGEKRILDGPIFSGAEPEAKRTKIGEDALSDDDVVLVAPPPEIDGKALDVIALDVLLPEGVQSNGGRADSSSSDDVFSVEEVHTDEDLVTKKDDTQEPPSKSASEKSFMCSLGSDIKTQLDLLKGSWHDGASRQSESCIEALQYMASCTPAQLADICDYIGTAAVSVADLPAICQLLIPLSTQFSLTSATVLAEQLYLKKVKDLTQTAPRSLLTSLSDFTRAFPKPTIEGALTPCLVHPGSTHLQFDLVAKVIKDALTNDHIVYLVRNIFVNPSFHWSESTTSFIQSILDCKLEVDSSFLHLLVSSLERNAVVQSKCKKFAKLLLAVINKYGKECTPDHVTRLQRSAEVNQTFLKKACLAALKKVQR